MRQFFAVSGFSRNCKYPAHLSPGEQSALLRFFHDHVAWQAMDHQPVMLIQQKAWSLVSLYN